MHGVKDQEGKTVGTDNTEASPDKETVLLTHRCTHRRKSSCVNIDFILSSLNFPLNLTPQTISPKRKSEEAEESPGLHHRGSNSQPLKRLKVNILKIHKCAVCSFTTEDVAAFHGHIPQHKSDGSSFQCQQCGLCYTSHHSLARHLFIVHRLKEPQGLGRCKGRGKDDDESQRENQLDVTDENSDGTPNTKCKVCAKVFETEGHLNTHMRTHGMAFIKSKRLSASEKWEERRAAIVSFHWLWCPYIWCICSILKTCVQ